MASESELDRIDQRITERTKERRQKLLAARNPEIPVIDASRFSQQVSNLAITVTNLVEREGPKVFVGSTIPADTAMILRQLTQTYDLLRFVNGDDTRQLNPSYRSSYSFVCLPLVRTMIDGFYNCTALLDDPSRAKSFRISGLYRKREALVADQEKYGLDPTWQNFLQMERQVYEDAMRTEGYSNADLDDKANKWPLLGEYLKRGEATAHKRMLRTLTHGFWKEYSSISHASYDGLIYLFPFIAKDLLPVRHRAKASEAAERHLGMHVLRAAGILLCLLTELQAFYKFDVARVDERLCEMWAAMLPVLEVKEFYDMRYKDMLRTPTT